MADHRIVIQKGGIHEILKITEEEKELLKRLIKIDDSIQEIRKNLRRRNTLTSVRIFYKLQHKKDKCLFWHLSFLLHF